MNMMNFDQSKFIFNNQKANQNQLYSPYMSRRIMHLLQSHQVNRMDRIEKLPISLPKKQGLKTLFKNMNDHKVKEKQGFQYRKRRSRAKSQYISGQKDLSQTTQIKSKINQKTSNSLYLTLANDRQTNRPIHTSAFQRKRRTKSNFQFIPADQSPIKSLSRQKDMRQQKLLSGKAPNQDLTMHPVQKVTIINRKISLGFDKTKKQVIGWTPKMRKVFTKMTEQKNSKIVHQVLKRTVENDQHQQSLDPKTNNFFEAQMRLTASKERSQDRQQFLQRPKSMNRKNSRARPKYNSNLQFTQKIQTFTIPIHLCRPWSPHIIDQTIQQQQF